MVDFALEESERRICEIEILITRQEMRIAKVQEDGRAPDTSACQLLSRYRAALENAWAVHRRLLQSRRLSLGFPEYINIETNISFRIEEYYFLFSQLRIAAKLKFNPI